ncbi:IS66 family insertion sequence element accessory protein TnpA [Psychromonas hadalis]|uniref:IS66 family insertion sequence element accessory protein TnpA n=1 Tax=Psychromonas hadalis TaxID=211669 RepID=UPI0003B62FC1|nr:hypothetical protein [Psychromonas hadalis]
MHSKPLTKIQQDWLDHVNQATKKNLSMSAYAKQNNLALKAFYNARSSLMQKGILPSISRNHLVPLAQSLTSNPSVTTSCRITLCNGVIIELADVGISDLLNSANQL